MIKYLEIVIFILFLVKILFFLFGYFVKYFVIMRKCFDIFKIDFDSRKKF